MTGNPVLDSGLGSSAAPIPTENAVLGLLAAELPARRVNLKLPDSTVSFSIPAGVTTEAGLADFRRMSLAIAKGHSRRIVNIDGCPGRPRWQVTKDGFVPIRQSGVLRLRLVWAFRVARSYAEKWLTIARKATVERASVRAEMATIDAAIRLATPSPSDTQPGGVKP